jgi:hypothetical protein
MAEMSRPVARPLAPFEAPLGFIIAILLVRCVWGTAELTPTRRARSPNFTGSKRGHLHTGLRLRRGHNGKRKCNLPAPSLDALLNAPFEATGLFVGTIVLLAFQPSLLLYFPSDAVRIHTLRHPTLSHSL